MIFFAWALFLGILTWMFAGLLNQRHNPNSDPFSSIDPAGNREVRLERNANGHYVASGTINGYPVVFLLDTGATDVAVPEALAERIGLAKQAGGFSQTANGTVAVWHTVLDEVTLGAIKQQRVRASILPSMGGMDEVLLGMSFLKHIELEQTGNELQLRQR
ncbi:MAG: retropepsin-like aspartic protease family protein [bacterium]